MTDGLEEHRQLRAFLCHSSNDKAQVRELYRRLGKDSITPWLDEEEILPGQDWEQEITKAVRHSDVVIVCLSRGSINKRGYVQREIRHALNIADEQPDDTIFLIPLKFEECEVPSRLRRWQWVNLFEEKGYERLLKALRSRAQALGISDDSRSNATTPINHDFHPSPLQNEILSYLDKQFFWNSLHEIAKAVNQNVLVASLALSELQENGLVTISSGGMYKR